MKCQIISNATELFLTKGFKSVTMDDLASSMGMSKKTIYTYFKTKNDLINDVANYLSDTISTGIDQICSQQNNPIEELYLVNDFVQKNLKDEHTSPLFQLQKYYPQIHYQLIQKQFCVTHESILNNLRNGINSDLYRDDLDINFISRLYFMSITGIKSNEIFPSSLFSPHETTMNFLDYYIRAIATSKGVLKLEEIQELRKK